jgi:hypothetical protein
MSIEFLIIIGICLSLLVIFMPVFINLFDKVIFSLEIYNGTKFMSEMNSKINTLSALSNESYFTIRGPAIKDYNLSCKGDELILIIKYGSSLKDLKKKISLNCETQYLISNQNNIVLKKLDDKLLMILE